MRRVEGMIIGRYLSPRNAERFVALLALVSFVAVALGVAALVATLAVMNGFRIDYFGRLHELKGHAHVTGQFGPGGWRPVAREFGRVPGVGSVLPVVERRAMVSFRGRVAPAFVRGEPAARLLATPVISERLIGDLASVRDGGAAIGSRLAEGLGARPGDVIGLVSLEVVGDVLIPSVRPIPIAAVFETGVDEADRGQIAVSLETAQALFGAGAGVDRLEVVTDDPETSAELLRPLARRFEGRLVIADWRELNATIYEAVMIDRAVTFWIVAMIVMVAAFNILSGLVMLVGAKRRDIAILRTVGTTRSSLMRIFIGIGTAIGTAGTVAGALLGYALVANRKAIVGAAEAAVGAAAANPTVRYFADLPAQADPADVATVVALAGCCQSNANWSPREGLSVGSFGGQRRAEDQLQAAQVPAGGHPVRGVALLPLHLELARRRGAARRARHRRVVRDRPLLVREVRAADRQEPEEAPPVPFPHLAPGRDGVLGGRQAHVPLAGGGLRRRGARHAHAEHAVR